MSKRLILWSSVTLGILALIFGLSYLGTRQGGGASGALSSPPDADDHVKGSPTAKVTIVEYSDFQCPACAAYYPAVKQIADAYPNDVRVIYRHYPLAQIHKNATLASQAAEAAARQNKFWEMHDVLFNTQAIWGEDENADALFAEYAKSLGLDEQQFQKDLRSDEVQGRVARDGRSGSASGVNATPTFFVNGKKEENMRPAYDDFKRIVDAALAQ